MKGDLSRQSFDPAHHYASVRKQQGRVELDADWNEAQDIEAWLRTRAVTDIIGPAGAPIDDAAFQVTVNGADLQLSPGRYYVGGVMVENDEPASAFLGQPDVPAGAPIVLAGGGAVQPGAAPDGTYVAYLHVWPQHRSAVEQPDLREEALHGPDTTTRIRTVWQVGLVQVGPANAKFSCGSPSTTWDKLIAPSSGTLAAKAEPDPQPPADCSVPTTAGFRGLDNQLYRVEVLTGGAPGTATFAWSRDNGSVVASWVAGGDGSPVVELLEQAGRAGSTGFDGGCFVQLTDDQHELRFQPGTIAKVKTTVGDQIELDPTFPPTGPVAWDASRTRPRARRWDGVGTVPADGSPVDLELGISVTFAADPGAVYQPGDYWTFTARATTRGINWPESAPDTPIPRPPDGPAHGWARLAVVTKAGATWTVTDDCRPLFAGLTDQTTLSYLGGDGQTAPAPPAGSLTLPDPLRVGVSTGSRPVAGALVRFTADPTTGTLAVVTGDGVSAAAGKATVRTGADGVAAVAWTLAPSDPAQSVVAELVDEQGTATYLPVRFAARILRAAEVTYDPAACANLAGASTVQQALDVLCALDGSGCSTITVTPDNDWVTSLANLPEGQDATICFRPGLYRADRRALLLNLGNVKLSGGGPATVVQVASDEAALEIRGCQDVEVADLTLEVLGYPLAPMAGQDGVLTVVDATAVRIRDVRLVGPAGTEPRAACVTVRPGQLGRRAATARILDCDLSVGHAQTGALLIDVDRPTVSGCTITTPAKPGTLGLAKLFELPARRRAWVRRVLGRPQFVKAPTGMARPGGPGISLGQGWQLQLSSTVPVSEWQTLVNSQPPQPSDLQTKDTVDLYVNRLMSGVLNQPDQLPTYARQLNVLRPQLGGDLSGLFERPDSQILRRGLLASNFSVAKLPPAAPGLPSRGVQVQMAGGTIQFESPRLGQAGWNRLLSAMPPPADAQANPVSMIRHLRAVALRIATDQAFGRQFGFEARTPLESANPAVAHQGVTIGGRSAFHVEVRGNTMTSVAEGVHVAFSAPGVAVASADVVDVRDNDITLQVPVERELAPRGIFVGNVWRSVSVVGNTVSVPGGAAIIGIEMVGWYGPYGLVRDNVLFGARAGIVFHQRNAVPSTGWLYNVVDNLASGASPVVDVDPANLFRVTGNAGPLALILAPFPPR